MVAAPRGPHQVRQIRPVEAEIVPEGEDIDQLLRRLRDARVGQNLPAAAPLDGLGFRVEDLEAVLTSVQRGTLLKLKFLRKMKEEDRDALRKMYNHAFAAGTRKHPEFYTFEQMYKALYRRTITNSLELIEQLMNAWNSKIALMALASVERTNRQLNGQFEEEDYARKRRRYEAEATFETENRLRPTYVANAHEVTMAEMAANLKRDLAQMRADALEEDRAERIAEADKQRRHDIDKEIFAMKKVIGDTMTKLMAIKAADPEGKIAATIAVFLGVQRQLDDAGVPADGPERELFIKAIDKRVQKALEDANLIIGESISHPTPER